MLPAWPVHDIADPCASAGYGSTVLLAAQPARSWSARISLITFLV